MTQSMLLSEAVERVGGIRWSDTTLAKVIGELPWIGWPDSWLAGGALRRTLLGDEPDSDFDLFFSSEEEASKYRQALEERNFKVASKNEHCTTLTGPLAGRERVVQIVTLAYYESAEAVIDSFDFTICQFATDGTTLWCGNYSLLDLGRKRLAINRISYPISTLRRLIKYTKQGFYACDGTLRDILESAKNPDANFDIKYVD